jgi:hypothetical protein
MFYAEFSREHKHSTWVLSQILSRDTYPLRNGCGRQRRVPISMLGLDTIWQILSYLCQDQERYSKRQESGKENNSNTENLTLIISKWAADSQVTFDALDTLPS